MALLRVVFRGSGTGTEVELTDTAGLVTTHQLRGDVVFEGLISPDDATHHAARVYSTNSSGRRTTAVPRASSPEECELVLLAMARHGPLRLTRREIEDVPTSAELAITVHNDVIEVRNTTARVPDVQTQQREQARNRLIAI